MQIETTQKPIMRVGVVRGEMSDMREIEGQFRGLAGIDALIASPGVQTISMFPSNVVTSKDGPHDDDWYEAGVVIPADGSLVDGLTEKNLPGGRFARAVYLGPYEGMSGAWMELQAWITERGHTVREGSCYQLYRNNMGEVPDAELRTDLYVPID